MNKENQDYTAVRVSNATKTKLEQMKAMRRKRSIDTVLIELLEEIEVNEAKRMGMTVMQYRETIDKLMGFGGAE